MVETKGLVGAIEAADVPHLFRVPVTKEQHR
ncbi:MAG: hypothetical protein QOG20_877 [Pseudonocardiales bacterium]|jgi:hypothetical protein|nr:hypothetical protein [Pseudonocardiales bacterium]